MNVTNKKCSVYTRVKLFVYSFSVVIGYSNWLFKMVIQTGYSDLYIGYCRFKTGYWSFKLVIGYSDLCIG